ncbi:MULTISPECIES: hypothetical protein [Laceyella]|nr:MULTISPECIES: hypothetical protein [Laceyella]UWE03417.1 hypothetical protein NYR52_15130 [Laceyella sacchari]
MGEFKVLRWKLMEEFEKEQSKLARASSRFNEKVQETQDELSCLHNELKAVIYREVTEEVDLSGEKEKLRAEIKKTEEAVNHAIEERDQANSVISQSKKAEITRLNLIRSWHGEYAESVRKQAEPILKRIEEARSEYYNSLLDLLKMIDLYDEKYKEVKDKIGDVRNEEGSWVVMGPVLSLGLAKLITDEELQMIERGQLPSDVKRKPTVL